ncbi:MAG: hypothetical protein ACOYON_16415 [Fimbriimonas sp.]
MEVSVLRHSAGFDIFTVRSGQNEVVLSAFGGQILNWTRAGVPIMFANEERAILDGKTPYRGGAPICFPQFSKGALLPSATEVLPQHGRARTSIWDAEIREQDNALIFRTEQPSAEGFGPTVFACELKYVFHEGVRMEARITNVGEAASPFQFAIHSYWASENPGSVTVEGMGERFLDNLAGLSEAVDADSSSPHTPPFDRVYLDDSDRQKLTAERYILDISTENCAGTVFWNPGPAHTIGDLGTPNFVCLESGLITPSRTLQPSEEHLLVVEYHATT